uniref:Uncharacterized protein n=1 Tax=Eptatretus burgeri TaxID=7764 RepID=A0A8C4QND4_EPTBU
NLKISAPSPYPTPSPHTPPLPSPDVKSAACINWCVHPKYALCRLAIPKGHFPRLVDCAHFHYDTVDFGAIQLSLVEDHEDGSKNGLDCSPDASFCILVVCQGRNWVVRRSWEDLWKLDSNLHVCIYDRRFSCLPEIGAIEGYGQELLSRYLTRLSSIADNKINCAPVLTWLEVTHPQSNLIPITCQFLEKCFNVEFNQKCFCNTFICLFLCVYLFKIKVCGRTRTQNRAEWKRAGVLDGGDTNNGVEVHNEGRMKGQGQERRRKTHVVNQLEISSGREKLGIKQNWNTKGGWGRGGGEGTQLPGKGGWAL